MSPGERIDLDLQLPGHHATDVPDGGWTYTLAVVAADGSGCHGVDVARGAEHVPPGSSAGTALPVGDIRAIEIRTASGTVLMRHELEATSDLNLPRPGLVWSGPPGIHRDDGRKEGCIMRMKLIPGAAVLALMLAVAAVRPARRRAARETRVRAHRRQARAA